MDRQLKETMDLAGFKFFKMVKGVPVFHKNEEFTEQEAENYVDYVLQKTDSQNKKLGYITLDLCADGKVDIGYQLHGVPFERIRRITGYLTGNLNTWNNSKRAEESERVKHGIRDFLRDGCCVD